MQIKLPCRLGEFVTHDYVLVGFDKGLHAETLYVQRPDSSKVEFLINEGFEQKYEVNLPIGENLHLPNYGIQKKASAELFGVIVEDNGDIWWDFIHRKDYSLHERYQSRFLNEAIRSILPGEGIASDE